MNSQAVGRNDPCPCGSGKKFKKCCLGKNESVAFGRGAAAALRRAMEGQEFNSLEEAQAFVTHHTQQQNQSPVDEFHGLSPEQMHHILDLPFASPQLVQDVIWIDYAID